MTVTGASDESLRVVIIVVALVEAARRWMRPDNHVLTSVVFVIPARGVRFFFFFQAEDGIRDLIVTGVQTCALPISLCVSALGVFALGVIAKGRRALAPQHRGDRAERGPQADLQRQAVQGREDLALRDRKSVV